MRGGLANCPSCSRAVEVPGAADENAYWLLIGLGALAAIGIAALVAVTASPVAGAITLVVEAAILGMIIAFS
jgi:hypothetical protein